MLCHSSGNPFSNGSGSFTIDGVLGSLVEVTLGFEEGGQGEVGFIFGEQVFGVIKAAVGILDLDKNLFLRARCLELQAVYRHNYFIQGMVWQDLMGEVQFAFRSRLPYV